MDEVDDEGSSHGEGDEDNEPEGVWFAIKR